MRSDKKKRNKTEKDRKNKEKENNDETDLSENEIPDLNSLKPFKFEPQQTLDILSVPAVMMRKKVLNIK